MPVHLNLTYNWINAEKKEKIKINSCVVEAELTCALLGVTSCANLIFNQSGTKPTTIVPLYLSR